MTIKYLNQTCVASFPGSGFQLLRLDPEGIIDKEPVIGFLVYSEPSGSSRDTNRIQLLEVYPVTATGVYSDCGNARVPRGFYALLRPDGVVDAPEDGCTYPSVAEFEQALKLRHLTKEQLK
jgi:hypothetical protein